MLIGGEFYIICVEMNCMCSSYVNKLFYCRVFSGDLFKGAVEDLFVWAKLRSYHGISTES